MLSTFYTGRSYAQTPFPLEVVATESSPTEGHYTYNDSNGTPYVINLKATSNSGPTVYTLTPEDVKDTIATVRGRFTQQSLGILSMFSSTAASLM